jgi:hypothetical protein
MEVRLPDRVAVITGVVWWGGGARMRKTVTGAGDR